MTFGQRYKENILGHSAKDQSPKSKHLGKPKLCTSTWGNAVIYFQCFLFFFMRARLAAELRFETVLADAGMTQAKELQ